MASDVDRERRLAWLGPILILVAAVVLALAVWRTVELGRTVGGDTARLERERTAIMAARAMLPTYEAILRYRTAVAVGAPSRTLAAMRRRIDAGIGQLDATMRSGAFASLNVGGRWKVAIAKWRRAEHARGQRAVTSLDDTVQRWIAVFDRMQDASGLTYDPNPTAQNLADATLATAPRALAAVEHARMYALLELRNGGLPLRERLGLASMLDAVKGFGNFSVDDIPQSLAAVRALVPNSAAATAAAGAAVVRDTAVSNEVATRWRRDVLLVDRPRLSAARIDADARRAHDAALGAFDRLAALLDRTLAERQRLARQRGIWWMLTGLGALLLVAGISITVAQLGARRARRALRLVRAELARRRAEEARRMAEAQFRAVFERAAIGIAVLDERGTLLDANERYRSVFGNDACALIASREREFSELMRGERDGFETELHVLTPGGQEAWVDAVVALVRDEQGAPRLAVCTFRDLTALKHSERRLLHDKLHDALTGLPNRTAFMETLHRRFAGAPGLLESFFAVLFVDLDRFKDVNESLGHTAGDYVLTQIADRLRTGLDPDDVVARLGSDEFAILVQSLGDVLHVETLARRLLNAVGRPLAVGDRTIYCTASIGIAIGSTRYERAEELVRDANIAMHHAKASGGGRYELFDSMMHASARKRLQLSTDLRLALERKEFRLLYQPIVDLADGRMVACEALLRWDHPTEGVMHPTDFMPLAEQIGLAPAIGRFVLHTACEQLARWKHAAGVVAPQTLHVNVSVSELADPDFDRILTTATANNGLHPEEIVVEITESVVLDHGTRANVMLERIRSHGFRICIDDFGTGYSSLRYLQQFVVDAIKIDRGFVTGPEGTLASEPIVRTLMALAESFDVRIVAEGVETARQRDQLRELGCRYAQGYLFARPLAPNDFAAAYLGTGASSPHSASA